MIQAKLIFKAALISTFLLLGSNLALGQQASAGVTPGSVEATVKPGSTYTQSYVLSNNGSAPLRFRASVIDYWYDANDVRVFGPAGTLPHSASNWIQFTPAEVLVGPHSSGTIKATVTIPAGARGGYYSMPVFEGLPAVSTTSEKTGASTAIGFRFRGLMMLAIEGSNKYQLDLIGRKLSPPSATKPLELELQLRNNSTVHLRLRGSFAILDNLGAMAGRGKFEPVKVLPGQSKRMNLPWAGELSPGAFTALVTVTYDRIGMEPATQVYEIPFVVAPPEPLSTIH